MTMSIRLVSVLGGVVLGVSVGRACLQTDPLPFIPLLLERRMMEPLPDRVESTLHCGTRYFVRFVHEEKVHTLELPPCDEPPR